MFETGPRVCEGYRAKRGTSSRLVEPLSPLSALHGRDIAPCRRRSALNSEAGNQMGPRICL